LLEFPRSEASWRSTSTRSTTSSPKEYRTSSRQMTASRRSKTHPCISGMMLISSYVQPLSPSCVFIVVLCASYCLLPCRYTGVRVGKPSICKDFITETLTPQVCRLTDHT
jgi:hypothetical protein